MANLTFYTVQSTIRTTTDLSYFNRDVRTGKKSATFFLADLVANLADLFALKPPILKPSTPVCRYADATLDLADWTIGRFSADQNRNFFN